MRRSFLTFSKPKPEHVVKQRIVPTNNITKLFPTNNTTKLFPFSNQILKQSILNLTNPNLASSKTPVVKINQTSPKSSSKTPVINVNHTPTKSSSKTPVFNINQTSLKSSSKTPVINVNHTPTKSSSKTPVFNINQTSPKSSSSKTPVFNINQTSPKSSSSKTPVFNINQTSPKSSSSKTPVFNINQTSPKSSSKTPVFNIHQTSPEKPLLKINNKSKRKLKIKLKNKRKLKLIRNIYELKNKKNNPKSNPKSSSKSSSKSNAISSNSLNSSSIDIYSSNSVDSANISSASSLNESSIEIDDEAFKYSLDELLKNTFDKYPLDHSFDKKAILEFIRLSDPKIRNICERIFKYTKHISFHNFLLRLNNCIRELLGLIKDNSKPIYIYVNKNQNNYKSIYWLYQYIKNYINFLGYRIIIINDIDDERIINNDNIVFIDDCIYNTSPTGDVITKIKNSKSLNLNFFILVPYITDKGIKVIEFLFNLNQNLKLCKLYFMRKKYVIKHNGSYYLTDKDNEFINSYYEFFSLNFSKSYWIYFDHSIGNRFSTISSFYKGLVPNQHNKNLIKSSKKKHNKLNIVPVIKNCNKKLNLLYSKCPYPPYKKSFNL